MIISSTGNIYLPFPAKFSNSLSVGSLPCWDHARSANALYKFVLVINPCGGPVKFHIVLSIVPGRFDCVSNPWNTSLCTGSPSWEHSW